VTPYRIRGNYPIPSRVDNFPERFCILAVRVLIAKNRIVNYVDILSSGKDLAGRRKMVRD